MHHTTSATEHRGKPRARLMLGMLSLGMMLPASALAVEVELGPTDDVSALTSSMQPGDVYTFTGGLYELETGPTWRGVGTESEPIILKAKEGDTPVIQITSGGAVATLEDAAYITIEGIVFTGNDQWNVEDSGANWYGLRVNNSSNITIENCEIRQTVRQGILATGDGAGLVVRRTHIHDILRDDAIYAGCGNGTCAQSAGLIENNWLHDFQGSNADGIEIGPNSFGFEIYDNVIYNSADGGIATKATNFGDPNIVEANVVWATTNEGIDIDGGAIVRNNIVFNTQGYGITSGPDDVASAGAIVISHNTIVGTASAGILVDRWAGADGMVLANNAVTNVTGIAMDLEVDEFNFLAGNVATGLVVGATEGFEGGGGLGDYVDPEEWNFWPSGDSNLIGSADVSADSYVPSLDFNGLPRPGDAPDVGALERDGSTNPGWQIREGFKEDSDPATVGGSETVNSGCGCSDEPDSGAQATPTAALIGLMFWFRRRRY